MDWRILRKSFRISIPIRDDWENTAVSMSQSAAQISIPIRDDWEYIMVELNPLSRHISIPIRDDWEPGMRKYTTNSKKFQFRLGTIERESGFNSDVKIFQISIPIRDDWEQKDFI